MTSMREDLLAIVRKSIESALPDQAVAEALKYLKRPEGKLILVAVGKAAWQMAYAAEKQLGDTLDCGVCITKYGHVKGEIPHVTCIEAGHPVPDGNSIRGARVAENLVSGLSEKDTVLFLVSGGGSALFEDPLVPLEELQNITSQLLASGADITEMNCIRKRLSRVKGGHFGKMCAPARVFSIVLSDIIGDPLDMIASGPAYPDSSTCEDALQIVEEYQLTLSDTVMNLLTKETPKHLDHVETYVTGSVKQLCHAAMQEAEKLGYEPVFLTASLNCTARDAGSFLSSIARDHADTKKPLAYVAGGETVVHLTGNGLGGRNQELALAAAEGIDGLDNCALVSVGSDGTDGPTDAAGGIVDGMTAGKLKQCGISIPAVLAENDAYHALKQVDGLVMTGATGTNVNDVTVLLLRPAQ